MTILYMLDTNIISGLARNPGGPVARHIAEVGPDVIRVGVVTAAELRHGCAKKGSSRLLAQIEAILGGVQVLALDVPVDVGYGGIRAELEAAGQPVRPNDLLIAAHAHALDAVLVTANVREFSRIRALRIENWLSRGPVRTGAGNRRFPLARGPVGHFFGPLVQALARQPDSPTARRRARPRGEPRGAITVRSAGFAATGGQRPDAAAHQVAIVNPCPENAQGARMAR